jgi:hypothetical protein
VDSFYRLAATYSGQGESLSATCLRILAGGISGRIRSRQGRFLSAVPMAIVVFEQRYVHDSRGHMNHQALSSFIWSVADLLRGDYKQSDCGKGHPAQFMRDSSRGSLERFLWGLA